MTRALAFVAATAIGLTCSFGVASAAQTDIPNGAKAVSSQKVAQDDSCEFCVGIEVCIEWKNGGETCFTIEDCYPIPCGGDDGGLPL
jgi:hypothetical protein